MDLGEYHAVRKALLRLEEADKIQKIIRGVYYYPRYSELINVKASEARFFRGFSLLLRKSVIKSKIVRARKMMRELTAEK